MCHIFTTRTSSLEEDNVFSCVCPSVHGKEKRKLSNHFTSTFFNFFYCLHFLLSIFSGVVLTVVAEILLKRDFDLIKMYFPVFKIGKARMDPSFEICNEKQQTDGLVENQLHQLYQLQKASRVHRNYLV